MTLKTEYYKYILDEIPKSDVPKEKQIVFDIVNDFTDRRGIGQEWDQIDESIQEEIMETWIDIVKTKLDSTQ